MPSELSNFGLTETLRTGRALHRAAAGTATMESSARRICRALYEELVDEEGKRACALVRCYKTHEYGKLPTDLQRFARKMLDPLQSATPTMRCLTLLGTVGELPSWNNRRSSRGHQAIPLPSSSIVARAPMIARLVKDFGLQLDDLLSSSPEAVRNLAGRTYDVFHVEEASGSESIPAQEEFVERHGVRSVVGFGGSLSSGDLFAVILFSRVHVPRDAADRFRMIALDVKTLFFGFDATKIFDLDGTLDSAGGESLLHS